MAPRSRPKKDDNGAKAPAKKSAYRIYEPKGDDLNFISEQQGRNANEAVKAFLATLEDAQGNHDYAVIPARNITRSKPVVESRPKITFG